ncbi:predicted protein [Streptomyces viridochromogenes DSM 40736]|uniref:Predicted protein n=1 Tax=Streptomyces viridochromogenes (strain DSM 40736 / JCM 4977 / BCRC 1201 / Tue 494) TaxID=591159 RepID=D9XEZ1_STRVT|nr:predicted protein [Streptomyces viridochromogenes DSM 40736]
MKTRIAVPGFMITSTPDKVPLSPLEPADTHMPAPAELPGREPVELRRTGL